jgi:hypothetical protein
MKPSSAVSYFGLAMLLISAGCSKPASGPATQSGANNAASAPAASDRDAIAQAIQRHLSNNKGIRMDAMDMNLTDVSINGDQAQANAEFRPKQGGGSMLMTYFLERHGGGWIVVRNQPGGGQFAHPPMDRTHTGAAPGSGQMPMPDVNDFFKKKSPHEESGSPSQE